MSKDVRFHRETILRAAALAGDELAWQELFDNTFDSLNRLIADRSGHLADDVIQEAWLVAARRLKDFDPALGSFQSWIFGIAVGVSARQRRSEGRRRAVQLVIDPDRDILAMSEEEQAVHDTIDRLPNAQAKALRMRYLQGESVAEIARIMQLTYKGAESLLSRARQAFRTAFQRGKP